VDVSGIDDVPLARQYDLAHAATEVIVAALPPAGDHDRPCLADLALAGGVVLGVAWAGGLVWWWVR
jgi:hypothetical protein